MIQGYCMLELERTFLAKFLPKGLEKSPCKEILDIYVPKESSHSALRIRKNGSTYEITKKTVPNEKDHSVLLEENILLTAEEFAAFSNIPANRVHKIRYYHPFQGYTAEVDIFQDELKGLVLVDFEFENEQQKNAFQMPDFCLADVTEEEFLAGGKLCGKKFADIEAELKRFGYRKIRLTKKMERE